MTRISSQDRIWLARVWSALALVAVWAYSLVHWMGHPNGAARILMALMGFAVLGLGLWVAPFQLRMVRIAVRATGTAVALAAFVLFVFLVIALRNGL
jgi:hypothetical protein